MKEAKHKCLIFVPLTFNERVFSLSQVISIPLKYLGLIIFLHILQDRNTMMQRQLPSYKFSHVKGTPTVYY